MNATELTCPYCNARVGDSTQANVVCPRCGESFANRTAVQTPPASAPTTTTSEPLPAVTPLELRPPAPRNNRLVLGVTLTVMASLAIAALGYALLTQQTRRDHDKELPRGASRRSTRREVEEKVPPKVEPRAP